MPRRRPVASWRAGLPSGWELLQHLAIAGPLCGVLSAAYHAWLIGHAPVRPLAESFQTIRLAASFHGRHLPDRFVSAGQMALWWALSLPAAGSLIALVAVLAAMGLTTLRNGRRSGRAVGRRGRGEGGTWPGAPLPGPGDRPRGEP